VIQKSREMEEKKEFHGPLPLVGAGSVDFSTTYLQPHWADMAEKAGLSCSRWLDSMCVALLVREQGLASGFKPAIVVAGEFHWTSAAVVAVWTARKKQATRSLEIDDTVPQM
jgi:hypothetical protein